MTIEFINYMEWVLMAAFLFAAFDARFISLCMLANIAIGHFAFSWMSEIPPEAAGAFITLVNAVTIIIILWKGEGIQKILQSIALLSFIALEPVISVGFIYTNYELILFGLYSMMLLSISRSTGRGIFHIYGFIYHIGRGGSSTDGHALFRNNEKPGMGRVQNSHKSFMETDCK